MSSLSEKSISVKEYDSAKDYSGSPVAEEIIEIRKFTGEEAFAMEAKGFFFMPSKITYFRRTAGKEEEVLAGLSQNKRKKMKKAIRNSGAFELVCERPLTEKTFLEWHGQVYAPNMGAKKHGIVIAGADWWKKDTEKCEKAGLFFRKGGKIACGMVARSYGKSEFLPRRMSISYSAGREDLRSLGLTDYLNVKMIVFAKECGYDYIFRGRDTNLYGKHLGAGIPVFKTSLGYEIMALKSAPDELLKFNDLGAFGDTIFFVSYAKDSEKLIGNLIFKKEPEKIDGYKKSFFEKLRIFWYSGGSLNLLEEISF